MKECYFCKSTWVTRRVENRVGVKMDTCPRCFKWCVDAGYKDITPSLPKKIKNWILRRAR